MALGALQQDCFQQEKLERQALWYPTAFSAWASKQEPRIVIKTQGPLKRFWEYKDGQFDVYVAGEVDMRRAVDSSEFLFWRMFVDTIAREKLHACCQTLWRKLGKMPPSVDTFEDHLTRDALAVSIGIQVYTLPHGKDIFTPQGNRLGAVMEAHESCLERLLNTALSGEDNATLVYWERWYLALFAELRVHECRFNLQTDMGLMGGLQKRCSFLFQEGASEVERQAGVYQSALDVFEQIDLARGGFAEDLFGGM